ADSPRVSSTFPRPPQAKALTMPRDDGLRLDNDEPRSPRGPRPTEAPYALAPLNFLAATVCSLHDGRCDFDAADDPRPGEVASGPSSPSLASFLRRGHLDPMIAIGELDRLF